MLASGLDYRSFAHSKGAFFMPEGEEMTHTTNLIIAIATILAALALFVFACFDKKRFSTRSIAYGAICLALSFGLSYIRLFHMPQGGSITPASMLPVMLYAYIFGTKKGVFVGVAYAGLQSIQDLFFVHPLQYILDYPAAFMLLGLVGFARAIPTLKLKPPAEYAPDNSSSRFVHKIKASAQKARLGLYSNLNGYPIGFVVGIVVACLGRFVCHTVSGAIFFGEYAGDNNVWAYSLAYNSFVWVECLICLVVGGLLFANRSARKYLFLSSAGN